MHWERLRRLTGKTALRRLGAGHQPIRTEITMVKLLRVASFFLILASPIAASGAVINFEDLSHGTVVTNQYAGLGATFGPGNFGVVGGISEGDPGNWDLDGTNGPHFLGFNGPYDQTITWSSDINGFSLDVSRSLGSGAGNTFTLTGLQNGVIVDSEVVALGAINTWTTVTLTGLFDEIQWVGAGAGFHPFGVDNLVFNQVVPEPSVLALSGLVVAAFGVRRFRRGARRQA
jgi:hypothetical protein